MLHSELSAEHWPGLALVCTISYRRQDFLDLYRAVTVISNHVPKPTDPYSNTLITVHTTVRLLHFPPRAT